MTRHATRGVSFEELAQLRVKHLGPVRLRGDGTQSVQPCQQPVPVHSALLGLGVTIPLWDPGVDAGQA